MKCKKCGAENPDDAKICASCGAELKKKSPALMVLLVIVIVVAIFALALLIRYAIVKDSYFAPFKQMFGLEEEDDDVGSLDEDDRGKDKDKTSTTKISKEKSLLSSKSTAKGVDHYVVTVDTEKMMSILMDSFMQSFNSAMNNPTYNTNSGWDTNSSYDFNSSYKPSSKVILDRVMDLRYNEDYYNTDTNYDDEIMPIDEKDENTTLSVPDDYRRSNDYNDSENSSTVDPEEIFEKLSDIVGNMELTGDVYADGNEIIEVLVTIKYGDALRDIYDFIKLAEEDDEDVTEEIPFEIDTYSNFEKSFNKYIRENLTKDMIFDALDDELQDSEKDLDIDIYDYEDKLQDSEKDLDIDIYDYEDRFELACIEGGLEFYFKFDKEMNKKFLELLENNEDEIIGGSLGDEYLEQFMDALDEQGAEIGISVEKD